MEEIKGVLDPVFGKILHLVQEQMNSVESMHNAVLKAFPLGSNVYLRKYLQKNLNSSVTVLQPNAG